MYLKQAICLCLIGTAILTTTFVFGSIQKENRGVLKVEGGAPMPPPAPWGFTGAGEHIVVG